MRYWLGLAALLLSGMANAALVRYDIILTVEWFAELHGPCATDVGWGQFGCMSVGDVFVGRLDVPEELLQTDGEVIELTDAFEFLMPMGAFTFSKAGTQFRNGVHKPFAHGPGVVIEGGEVVDLMGGPFTNADTSFVSAYPFGARNTFWAYDEVVGATGTLTIARYVPEPGTYWLVLLGLVTACGAAPSLRSRPRPLTGSLGS